MREFQGNGKNCPPKLGGQRHRMFFAMTRGVVRNAETFRFWNHPGASRHPS